MMRLPKNIVQPKTGETHTLFGTRTLKFHKFQDPDWSAFDKIAQYDGLIRLHEKDLELRKLRDIADRKQLLEKLKAILIEVTINQTKLKLALHGNPQEVKNILQNHVDLQILFSHMPIDMVKENMDQRTFTKRKELDRLKCLANKLGVVYRRQLLDFATLQNRIKYSDSKEMKERKLSKKLRMELKNSETRMRAIRTINHAYFSIINTMMHDAIYFEPTLKALSDDLIEQRDFIMRTIRMGKPALESLRVLQDSFSNLEAKTRHDIQLHLSDIYSHRDKINKNNEIIKKFVRNDSDFKISQSRYNRETNSMAVLKKNLEEIEDVMKTVKKATGCYHAEYIYARLRKQSLNNKQLEDKIVYKEREKRSLDKRDVYATVRKRMLQFNLTDDDIKRTNKINGFKRALKVEENIQKEHEKEMKENGEIVCLLRYAFQHFSEVLRNVGDIHTSYKIPYPNSVLNLPLLKFSIEAQRVKPPSPIEQDIETLLKITKMKVKLLMEKFNSRGRLQKDEEIKAEIMFHTDTIDELATEPELEEVNQQSLLLVTITTPSEDAHVPNRNFIKSMSRKIVEVNAHKED